MTKRLVLVAVFVLCAASAHGQQSNFIQSVDYPGQGVTVPSSQFYFAGWAFECSTGEHPIYAVPSLFNLDTQKWWAFETFWQQDHLLRQDVYDTFRFLCPTVHQYEGYHLHVVPQPPPGRYRVWLMWDDKAISRDIIITAG